MRYKNFPFLYVFGDKLFSIAQPNNNGEKVAQMGSILFSSHFPSQQKVTVALLDQQHSTIGYAYHSIEDIVTRAPLAQGDFHITNIVGVILALATADCIPLFLYDQENHAIAAIHSGWKGTAKNIVSITLEKMISEYGTKTKHIVALVGPSAGVCCYLVGTDCLLQFSHEYHKFAQRANEKVYLNLQTIILHQLKKIGILQKNIEIGYWQCTICTDTHHSFRREPSSLYRQLSMISLFPK